MLDLEASMCKLGWFNEGTNNNTRLDHFTFLGYSMVYIECSSK